MVSPDQITGLFDNVILDLLPSLMKWIGWGILFLAIMATFVGIYYVLQFQIKVDEYPLYGSGTDGVFSIGKRKKNRVRWVKNRTAWNSMLPLFNKKEIEPFDSEFIYPKNQIYAFNLNGTWCPGRINVNKSEDELRPEINPVPYYIRNWESLQYQKHEVEFSKKSFWDENKQLFFMLLTVVFCLTLTGVVVWWTFKFSGSAGDNMKSLTSAINNLNVIRGVQP